MWWWRTVALYWTTSRCCKCQSSCAQLPRSGALLGSFFPMVLCGGGPATMRRCHLHLCHGTPAILPRLFGQQQTSFGAPGQSLRHCALASLSAPAPWPATFSRWRSATAASLTRRSATAPQPATNLIRCARPVSSSQRPGQQLRHGAPASNIFPMARCHGGASHKALRHGAPANNKPHPAEKSTPVRLAIWRIWAGFANSQHRDAAFATPNDMCAHSSLLQQ